MFDFEKELANELSKYAGNITKEVKEIVKQEAEKLAENISNDSNTPKRTGKYRKGWISKKAVDSPTNAVYVVYNKNKPQLTHLLEYGHANRDGTRTEGIKHIEPNEEKALNSILDKIERAINNAN